VRVTWKASARSIFLVGAVSTIRRLVEREG
jgi:hypothetical protein